MSTAYRLHVAKVTAKRELRSTVYGIGLYVTLALIFLSASFFFVRGTLSNIIDSGVSSMPNPLMGPLYISLGLAAVYLGLLSALAISRDRDLGTLETLFYGPVDATSYVTGKYLHQIGVHLVVIAFALVNFYMLATMTQIGFSKDILSVLLLSIFLTSSMVSFGIFLSVSSKRMIVSIILFLALVLFFLGFSIFHEYVMALEARQISGAMVYVRIVMERVNDVLKWISPVSYFQRGLFAVQTRETGQYLLSILQSIVYSGVLLALSVFIFQKRGVRRG